MLIKNKTILKYPVRDIQHVYKKYLCYGVFLCENGLCYGQWTAAWAVLQRVLFSY